MQSGRFGGRSPLLPLALVAAIATSCAGPAAELAFFRGKTVNIIVPYGAGGGLDIYARTIAPFLQKYLPGSRVEVANLTEGGGIVGKNFVYAAAPDGLTLGFTPISGALLAEWEENPAVVYSTAKFSYLGRIDAEAHIMVVSPKSGFTKPADLAKAGRITMGFTGVGSDDYYVALISATLLGYRVDARTDFLSASDANLACVRGEMDALQLSFSNVQAQIGAKTILPLISFSPARLATLPQVPSIFEVIPQDRQRLMQSLVRIYSLDRMMIAPPGVGAGRLAVLRTALDRSMVDPELIANLAKVKRPVDYLSGAETDKLLSDIISNEGLIKPLVLAIARAAK